MNTDLEISSWLKLRDECELIIDARSPREYAYSHIKGAVNFYALDDTQHEQIGTLYKQNRAKAKVLGASYVCLNLSKHLPQIQELARVGARVGVYCARGGMRSNAIAQVLAMIGYRVLRLSGGYKAYRSFVQSYLNSPLKTRFITLFGNTGSRKTKLIKALSPSINLEAMAGHLGSVFGAICGVQPSQKAFEDALFERLRQLEGELCFIEGESRRIGSLTLPASLYEAMGQGVGVHIVASMHTRVACTMADYAKVDASFFNSCMTKIAPFIAKEAKEAAQEHFRANRLEKVCEILLEKYYDKVYKKPRKIDFVVNADDFETALSELENIRLRQAKASLPDT